MVPVSGRPTLGVLGGMGPLASAEFLRTFYRLQMRSPEQEMPPCLVLSDPSFPDRTAGILDGSIGAAVGRLEQSLSTLLASGADRVVIACVTLHSILPQVDAGMRARVVSLIDLVLDSIALSQDRVLLLATTGTRRARIFEGHEGWDGVRDRVCFPDERTQEAVHRHIYALKKGGAATGLRSWLGALPAEFGCRRLVLGCTELHLVSRGASSLPGHDGEVFPLIDPLERVARDWPDLPAPTPPG